MARRIVRLTRDGVTSPLATLVDVGARGGIDRRWAPYADVLHVVAIDADETAAGGNASGAARYDRICAAVGASAGPADFYVTRQPGCSSMLRPNRGVLEQFPEPERFDVVKTLTLQLRPLDDVLSDHRIAGADFIKLDTQGSELAILEGAPETLASALAIEVEVEFLSMYDGQPLFADIDGFLRARGFDLFDLNRVYWRRPARPAAGRGQIVFADALYFRSPESIEAAPNASVRLARAVLGAAAYRYVDYARTLLARGSQRHVFTHDESNRASAWLERAAPRRGRLARLTGTIRGAGRLSSALARAADAVRPDHWAYEDQRLGNGPK